MISGNGASPLLDVVAGFDGSADARHAVRWAAEHAARHRCPLHLVRVFEPPPALLLELIPTDLYGTRARRTAEAELLALADECRTRCSEVHAILLDGKPSTTLAGYTDAVAAGTLAVGAGSPLSSNSTVAELVRITTRPVVAVRAGATTVGGRVVAGVDDIATGAHVLAFAFDFAENHGTELHIVHAEADEPESALDHRYLRLWRQSYPSVPVTTDEVPEPAAPTLQARSSDARLLVVGSRQRGTVRRRLFGSVSRAVLDYAQCSVAVVPHTANAAV